MGGQRSSLAAYLLSKQKDSNPGYLESGGGKSYVAQDLTKQIVYETLHGRGSGTNFQVPKMALVLGCFSSILFLFPPVVSSRFYKQKLFLGTDLCLWS